jgi:hypothetical protein
LAAVRAAAIRPATVIAVAIAARVFRRRITDNQTAGRRRGIVFVPLARRRPATLRTHARGGHHENR